MQTVLETVHGSHLYRLAHAGSDLDTYRVVLGRHSRFAKQRKTGDDDRMTLSLDRFTEQVGLGVPQALEALWSPQALVATRWQPFLAGLRPSVTEVQMRYRHTILNFAFHRGGRTGSARERVDARKLRRHALRLTLNLSDLVAHGRFDPRLSDDDAAWVKSTADDPRFGELLPQLLEDALWSTDHRGFADTNH